MTTYEKPLPTPTTDTQLFWDYCKRHELRMQKCSECGLIRHPPSIICPRCYSKDVEWRRLSGKGTVYSFVVFHYPYHKAFKDELPYACAVIDLAEGPRMMSNIVGCKLTDIKIGMPVEVAFKDAAEGFALPKFKPSHNTA